MMSCMQAPISGRHGYCGRSPGARRDKSKRRKEPSVSGQSPRPHRLMSAFPHLHPLSFFNLSSSTDLLSTYYAPGIYQCRKGHDDIPSLMEHLFISQKNLPGTGIRWTGTPVAQSRAGQVRAVSLPDCVILGL